MNKYGYTKKWECQTGRVDPQQANPMPNGALAHGQRQDGSELGTGAGTPTRPKCHTDKYGPEKPHGLVL